MDQQFFEGPSKREIQKLNCQLWTKKMEAQVKVFFLVLFFSKNQSFKSGFQKKIGCPEFYFTSWIFVKKLLVPKQPYQGRSRAVSGPKPEISYFFILFHS